MSENEQAVMWVIAWAIVVASLKWYKLAGVIGLILCTMATWNLSTQMHLMSASGSEDFSALGTAFIGLLFVMRYRMGKKKFDNRVYETGTGTYYPSSGAVTKHYSTGFGRAFSTTVIGGMIIVVILAAILSGIRFG